MSWASVPKKSVSFLTFSRLNMFRHRKRTRVSSISRLQEHNGFMQSSKLYLNLCSFKWLRLKRKRVRNLSPFWSKILYILLWTGRLKDNNLLLNVEIDSEFLMLSSKLNQSFRVEIRGSWIRFKILNWILQIFVYSCWKLYG